MSPDNSSREGSDSHPKDNHDKVQPTIRDALIGAVIGLLLIYVGSLISSCALRWIVVGVGFVFVGVMSAFVISVVWAKMSPGAHRMISRARGHVRRDPQLGTLIRNVAAETWEIDFKFRDRTVEILIDGKDEPDPELVARARELLADFNAFERGLSDYLAQEAKEWASKSPESAADISALRLSSIRVRSRKSVLIDFDGPDANVYWSCEHADGKFSALDFDS